MLLGQGRDQAADEGVAEPHGGRGGGPEQMHPSKCTEELGEALHGGGVEIVIPKGTE
jgi:hypothetical protein